MTERRTKILERRLNNCLTYVILTLTAQTIMFIYLATKP